MWRPGRALGYESSRVKVRARGGAGEGDGLKREGDCHEPDREVDCRLFFPSAMGSTTIACPRDARISEARCDGEVRLYSYPLSDGSPEAMVDLTGCTCEGRAVLRRLNQRTIPG